jgi:hypothetical protein
MFAFIAFEMQRRLTMQRGLRVPALARAPGMITKAMPVATQSS